MSKYQGQRTATINSLCDDIIYCNYDKSKYNTVLFPVMAGVTNADPEYFIKRSPNDPAFKYLYVLEYVVSGRGYIEYEGQKYTVEAGDFYLLNRYTAPYYYPDPEEPFVKIWINICGRFMNAITYTYQLVEPIIIVHCESAEQYIRQMHEEILKHPNRDIGKANDTLMELLLKLFVDIDHLRQNRSPKNALSFSQITDYISNNIIMERLDVEYISTYFYISYSSLYRLCMKNTGLSPKHYILKLKIEYAQELFLTTNCSISRTSELLNFSSPAYFRKVFRKYVGMSPADWRRKKRSEKKK